jgi:hypothetical protein
VPKKGSPGSLPIFLIRNCKTAVSFPLLPFVLLGVGRVQDIPLIADGQLKMNNVPILQRTCPVFPSMVRNDRSVLWIYLWDTVPRRITDRFIVGQLPVHLLSASGHAVIFAGNRVRIIHVLQSEPASTRDGLQKQAPRFLGTISSFWTSARPE